jgi:putative thioredoxin
MARSGQFTIDVSEQTFERDIIEASLSRPILVDLWAAWCGPCKTLSPILEGLAEEGQGQWLLAKVDVDKNPRLAQAFQAQSIPLVVAIFQGQVVDQFMGAQPKLEVERWLTEVFRRCRLTLKKFVEPEVPTDPTQAEAFWKKRLVERPDDTKAKLGLGRLLFARGEATEAERVLNEIPMTAPEYGGAQSALRLKELIAEIGEAGGEEAIKVRMQSAPGEAETAYLAAILEGSTGRFALAVELLVDLVSSQPEPLKGRARKAASLLFEAAGRGQPEVETQRKRLARLLF